MAHPNIYRVGPVAWHGPQRRVCQIFTRGQNANSYAFADVPRGIDFIRGRISAGVLHGLPSYRVQLCPFRQPLHAAGLAGRQAPGVAVDEVGLLAPTEN